MKWDVDDDSPPCEESIGHRLTISRTDSLLHAMTTSLESARKNLREWLEDLSALKEWTDAPENQVRKEFTEAFDAALAKAKAAAKEYCEALK
jgi:hypothetical protein